MALAFRARLACKDLPRLAHNQHSGKRRLDSDTELFKPGLSTLKGYKATFSMDPGARPHFCKARPVSCGLRSKAEDELKRLERERIIWPIQFSDLATPIVPMVKSDSQTIRI